jgi:hypothetical protein
VYEHTLGHLYQTYYNGSWWTNTLNSSYDDTFYNGYMLYDTYVSGSWHTHSIGSWDNAHGCELALSWTDSTDGSAYWSSGVDGGCFYVASNGDLYLTETTNQDSVDISSGYEAPTTNVASNFGPLTRSLAFSTAPIFMRSMLAAMGTSTKPIVTPRPSRALRTPAQARGTCTRSVVAVTLRIEG